MNRVFPPLKADHPLVSDGALSLCPACHKPFFEGQRTMLAPLRNPVQGFESVPAAPVHATCALAGMKTMAGEILRIKDGDASPFPVELVGNKQATFAECGIDGK
jgi:hypothetical protein